ncbi:MAG: hypothetical protein QMD65_02025 [Patescibacteria group bacterium]|nr:hypothetical protein [Patescibacteria group bacterium]
MTKIIYIIGAIAILVVGFVLGVYGVKQSSLGGVYYQQADFISASIKDLSTNSLIIGAGTAQTRFFCNTATWNPGSIATSTLNGATVTSTNIALTGAQMGNGCIGSLSSATTTGAMIDCGITAAAVGTVYLTNVSASALDLATGTAKICYWQ